MKEDEDKKQDDKEIKKKGKGRPEKLFKISTSFENAIKKANTVKDKKR